jgi:O-antigen/teichoic acid export membrane protein
MTGPLSAAAANLATLRSRAFSLGSANALDYAMQFLLPVILARFLAPEAFGEYRLVWLVIMTVIMIVPMQMPGVLYYFLPRSDAALKRMYIHQTLVYLAVAGAIGAFVMSSYNPFQPEVLAPLRDHRPLVPILVVLYAASMLLDSLPTIDERIGWQARATLSITLLRTVSLAYIAYATGDLRLVIWALVGVLGLKLAVMLVYIGRYHGLGGRWFDAGHFREQFIYAAPLGLAVALYSLRFQVDQWVAAALFSLASFAAFSVAAVLGPLVNLFRQSINYVFLPSMSRLQAAGDLRGMVELNSRANVMVALCLFPLLALAFAFAEDVITLIYSSAYVAAAPVMRVYILESVVMIIELFSVMLLQREGAYVLRLNLALLAASALISWLGAMHIGLAGAAAGSVAAICIDRWLTLRRVARSTGIRIGAIQDWPALAGLLLSAALATALAWSIVHSHVELTGAFTRLLAGSAILATVYIPLVFSLHTLRRGRAASAAAHT